MFVILRRSTPKNLRMQRPFAQFTLSRKRRCFAALSMTTSEVLRVTGYRDTGSDIKNLQCFVSSLISWESVTHPIRHTNQAHANDGDGLHIADTFVLDLAGGCTFPLSGQHCLA